MRVRQLILFLIRLRFDYDQIARIVANRPNPVFDQYCALFKGWGKCFYSAVNIILKLNTPFNHLNKKGALSAARPEDARHSILKRLGLRRRARKLTYKRAELIAMRAALNLLASEALRIFSN